VRKNSMTNNTDATDVRRSPERRKMAPWKWFVIVLACLGLVLCIRWIDEKLLPSDGKGQDQLSPLPEINLPKYPISITQDQTIQVDTGVSKRYSVYRTETGVLMLYDAQEDRHLDLEQIILGDTSEVYNNLIEAAMQVAKEKYLDLYLYPVNQEYIKRYIDNIIASHKGLEKENIKLTPNLSFMSQYDEYRNWGDKEGIFQSVFLSDIYQEALNKMDYELGRVRGFYLNVYGIDETNGRLLLQIKTINGRWFSEVGVKYLVFDIQTDTVYEVPNTQFDGAIKYNEVLNATNDDGSSYWFSEDGSILTVAAPSVYYHGGEPIIDVSRYSTYDYVRSLYKYEGERMGVIFFDGLKTIMLPERDRGISNLFVSDQNKVLYYKVMDLDVSDKSFEASSPVWYNRLKLYNRDTDQWAFYVLDAERNLGDKLVLQGNIVRFAAQDRIVIMEREGAHYAYLLEDGRDVTEAVRKGKIPVYPHEKTTVTHEDGYLYAKNLFSGSRKKIAQADTFAMSGDGAFVFAYCNGNDYVTCYDVASLENRKIAIDTETAQMFAMGEIGHVRMEYRKEDDTLLISFRKEGEDASDQNSGIDFYAMLKKLEQQ